MSLEEEVQVMVKQFMQDRADADDLEDDVDDDDDVKEKASIPYVDWPSFNIGVGAVIVANAVTIGLETASRSEGGGSSAMWYLLEMLFCLIFVTELALRLYFHRLRYFGTLGQQTGDEAKGLLKSGKVATLFSLSRIRIWNIVDFAIVLISVIDVFILMPIGLGGTVRIVAMLRFVRLARLIRLIRLFRIFKELWLVARGLFHALQTLFWVCGVLGLIIEACAIVATRAVGQNNDLYDPYFKSSGGWDHEIYFKTVQRSMMTFTQIMTFDSWSDEIARHVGQLQPGMLVLFIVFICITSFGFMNLVVGVVIESTFRTANEDAIKIKGGQDRNRRLVFKQLREIFVTADKDGNGTLSLGEVKEAITKPEVYSKLQMIDFPVDDPDKVFRLLDYDDSGELTIEEFIAGCIRMKGQAKSKDLMEAQVAIDTMSKHFAQFDYELDKFTKKLWHLDATARALLDQGQHVFLDTREYNKRNPESKDATVALPSEEVLRDAPWLSGGKYLARGSQFGHQGEATAGDLRLLADSLAIAQSPDQPESPGSPLTNRRTSFSRTGSRKDLRAVDNDPATTMAMLMDAQNNSTLPVSEYALVPMPGSVPHDEAKQLD